MSSSSVELGQKKVGFKLFGLDTKLFFRDPKKKNWKFLNGQMVSCPARTKMIPPEAATLSNGWNAPIFTLGMRVLPPRAVTD